MKGHIRTKLLNDTSTQAFQKALDATITEMQAEDLDVVVHFSTCASNVIHFSALVIGTQK
jgi:hypothetical protein